LVGDVLGVFSGVVGGTVVCGVVVLGVIPLVLGAASVRGVGLSERLSLVVLVRVLSAAVLALSACVPVVGVVVVGVVVVGSVVLFGLAGLVGVAGVTCADAIPKTSSAPSDKIDFFIIV